MLTTELGKPADHWDTCGRQGACDFRVQEDSIVVEVKRITSESYQKEHHRWQLHNGPYRSSSLARNWICAIPMPTHDTAWNHADNPAFFRKLPQLLEVAFLDLERRGVDQVTRDSDYYELNIQSGSGIIEGAGTELYNLLRGGSALS